MTGLAAAEPSVAVVVLNYAAPEESVRCAEAVLASEGVRPRLRIVDNHSPDGSGARLVERFGEERVLLRSANGGFAGGMNAGISWWREQTDAEFVLLLTQDVRVLPDTLARLVHALREHSAAGAAGPCVHYPQAYGVSCSAGGYVDRRRIRIGHREGPPALEVAPVEWLDGGCLLLRRRAVEEVGAFDEAYFMYFEENDLCHRLRARGWDVVLVSGAVAVHDTPTLPAPHYFYYMTRNSFRFWRQHHGAGFGRVAAAQLAGTIRMFAGAARAAVVPRLRPELGARWTAALRQAKGFALGTADAAAGRWGRQRY
jgi:N-acetylglucosaminyl-diphospho-decaprenol L-rhamnosyltransferase